MFETTQERESSHIQDFELHRASAQKRSGRREGSSPPTHTPDCRSKSQAGEIAKEQRGLALWE